MSDIKLIITFVELSVQIRSKRRMLASLPNSCALPAISPQALQVSFSQFLGHGPHGLHQASDSPLLNIRHSCIMSCKANFILGRYRYAGR